jgi:hypothetical protein
MNLKELNGGTPQTKQWLKPVFGKCDIGETTYEYTDTPTVLPPSGSSKLYIKNDGKVYTIDSTGVERIIEDSVGDLTDLENKTQNIDLAGTTPNFTKMNGTLRTNSIKFTDTATTDLRAVGDNRIALVNSGSGASPTIAVFNSSAINGVVSSIQVAENGGGNNGCQLQWRKDQANSANNHACLVVQGGVACALELYQDGRAIFEGTSVEMQSATINGNLSVQTINNNPVNTYGQWSQLGNLDIPLTATGTEFDLTGSGVGTLTVDTNEMLAGASWHVKLGGTLNTADKDDITFKTYWIDPLGVQPDQLIFDSAPIDLADTAGANQQWEYEFDFTIRVAGANGTMYSNNQLIYSKAQTENSGRVASKWQNTTGLDMTYDQNWKFTVEWNTNASPHTIINRMVRIQKVF